MPKIGLTYETNIGTRVTRETKDRLLEMANRDYRTLSMQVRRILEQYLAGELVCVDNVKQFKPKKQDIQPPGR